MKLKIPTASRPEMIGDVKYHRAVSSPLLAHSRDVIVWLPPSYSRARKRRYPVLYMHDGQNLFDPATAFLGTDWRVDETVDRLIRLKRLNEIIIVGIYNTPDRLTEYAGGKEGKNFARFVVEELKPFIDKNYRTHTDARHTAVIGSSMGGLCAFQFAWWYPEVFSQAGCMSGSFFWNEYRIYREVKAHRGPKKKIRIYLDVGAREKFLVTGYKKMTALLKARGYRKGLDLEYFLDRNGSHNEHCWGNRLWRPLMFMFGKHRTSRTGLL